MSSDTFLFTGACGFIASNFVNYLFPRVNGKFINLDALHYCANPDNILEEIRNSKRYKFIKGNICDYNLVAFILEEYQVDIIFHFAANSHVTNSFNESLQYTKDNVLGTHTLLEAARKYGKIKKFIHVSSDEVYGESSLSDNNPKTERTLLCPTNPYSASKRKYLIELLNIFDHFTSMSII